MLKTRSRFHHKDQTMSLDPQSDPVGHNNNSTKPITTTNPLALSLLIGLNKNKCTISDSDFVRSPKSPLEFRILSTMAEPLFFLRSPISSLTAHLNCCSGRPPKVGLSIVGDDRVLSPDVLFGPALRIKSSEIIDKHPKKPVKKIEKERSGVVFEIGDSEPIGFRNRSNDCLRKNRVLSRGVCSDNAFSDMEEEEMSEDYTCIIAHGANPKTTHIYGDRVLECHENDDDDHENDDDDNKEKRFKTEFDSTFASDNFLTLCSFCNKKLDVREDIYMYREKAFCSEECRTEEIMIDEEDVEDLSIPLQESLKKLF